MVPRPYSEAKRTGVGTPTFDCPQCEGTLHHEKPAWTCQECAYVSRHGAD